MPWSSNPPTATRYGTGWSVTPTATRPPSTGWFARPRVQITAVPMTAAAQLRTPTATAGSTITAPAMTATAAHRPPRFDAITIIAAVPIAASATSLSPTVDVSVGIDADPMSTLTAGMAAPAVDAFNGDATVAAVPLVAFPAVREPDVSAGQAVTASPMTADAEIAPPVLLSGNNTSFPYRFGFPLGVGAATGKHVSARRMAAAAAMRAPAVVGSGFPYTLPLTLD